MPLGPRPESAFIHFVVDQEQPGIGRSQPGESQVGADDVVQFVVLNQGLQEYLGRKRIGQTQMRKIGLELSAGHGNIEIVVVIGELRAE